MRKTIIAVDPGTRFWGVTVFRGEDIIVSLVKVLSTKGSPRKRLNEVKKVFSSLIKDYAPDVLVLEKPFLFWSKQSHLLNVLIEEIKSLARKEKMKIYEFSPRTVRKAVCGNGNATKKDMAKVICSIYPGLKIHLNQDRRYKELYWGHMFDSAGLGVCYLKTKQKTKCSALF